MYKRIISLIKKDIYLDWSQRFQFSSLLLYSLLTIYIVYINFFEASPKIWNILLWIILLFTSINAIAKSFIAEDASRFIFYYTLARPAEILIAKIIYNILLMLLITVLSVLFYSLFIGYPVQHTLLFFLTLVIGSIGFSTTLTILSMIVSKAGGNISLMAILGMPLLIPLIAMLVRLSYSTLEVQSQLSYSKEFLSITVFVTLLGATSYLLFPYIWRD